jgi:uncharacterized protein YndB with AHSA1/START domain
MILVERSITIDRPVREVFAYVTDPANDPNWQPDVLETTRPDGAMGTGSRYSFLVKFMGRRRVEAQVETLDPERTYAVRVLSGPPFGLLPFVTYTFEPTNGGTRLTRRVQAQPSGFGRVMEPMMKSAIGRYTTRYLDKLRGILQGT